MEISSVQNPRVKLVTQLQEKSRARKKNNLFVLEGKRELSIAIKCGYDIESIFYFEKLISNGEIIELNTNAEVISISKEIYQKIAYRESTEGIIAIVKTKHHTLNAIRFKNINPLILVAEAPEKPGNIGALLRTADAANVDAVLIANPKTDLYNPNIIRSSVGCVFSASIAMGSTSEIITFLQDNNITIYAATLQNSNAYHIKDYTKASALVVGTESTGLSQEWLDASEQHINIPMQGQIDSMNVSVAAGILIFEAKRQRLFNQ